MSTETYRLTWQGIEIELTYKPEDYGGVIAHLEVNLPENSLQETVLNSSFFGTERDMFVLSDNQLPLSVIIRHT